MPSTCATVTAAGSPANITKVRKYLGAHVLAAAAAAVLDVYAGDGTGDPRVGGARAVPNDGNTDSPPDGVMLDHGAPKNQLHVTLSGASAIAIIWYEPAI